MNASEHQREDRPFESLEHDGPEPEAIPVLHEILHELLVVKAEPDEPTDREDDQQEEEKNHEDMRHFVRNVPAEEVSALAEEVEGKLLDVSLVDDEKNQPVEGVLPEKLGDPEVKEHFEDQ